MPLLEVSFDTKAGEMPFLGILPPPLTFTTEPFTQDGVWGLNSLSLLLKGRDTAY